MIVKDKIKLKQKCEIVSSIDRGEEIAAKLFNVLSENKNGIGLAANQIGINERVCVINVKEPIYFINPKIVDTDGTTVYAESCLSFPGEVVKTIRHRYVTIESDNHGKVILGSDEYDDNLFESVCAQHEIDHLNGVTMFDRQLKQKPYKREEKKFGRNEKVTITDGTETKTIKYKKAQPLLESDWSLVEA